MKKLNPSFNVFVVLIVLLSSALNAQQDPLFSQFSNTKNLFNPATSGLNYKFQACVLAREQWVGVNGAPSSQLANYSMKLDKIHGGIGVNYLHGKIGFSETNTVKLNYSYLILFKNEGILALGVAAGIQQYKFKPTWIAPTTSQDQTLPGEFSDARFTADFGIAYTKEKFNIGLSATHLNEAVYTGNSNEYQSLRHYYLFADYTFGNEEGFQFRPELLTRTDFVKLNTQINILWVYKGKYTLGVGVRQTDAFIAMIGWDIQKKFRIAYSYDYTINKLSSVSRGSHEIVLGFYLK